MSGKYSNPNEKLFFDILKIREINIYFLFKNTEGQWVKGYIDLLR